MNRTYGTHSDICTRFYDLVYDPDLVARFILDKLDPLSAKSGLFIGGMFLIAKQLISCGIDLTISDYSDEMIVQGNQRLPESNFVLADLKALPFKNQFDSILVVGRVFTHMLTDLDASNALRGIYESLRSGGIISSITMRIQKSRRRITSMEKLSYATSAQRSFENQKQNSSRKNHI